MMASRGMGAINPSKMPGAKKKARRDDTDFTLYDNLFSYLYIFGLCFC